MMIPIINFVLPDILRYLLFLDPTLFGVTLHAFCVLANIISILIGNWFSIFFR